MRLVEGGSFYNGYGTVRPTSYCVSKHEITKDLYEEIMGDNPSDDSGDSIRIAFLSGKQRIGRCEF